MEKTLPLMLRTRVKDSPDIVIQYIRILPALSDQKPTGNSTKKCAFWPPGLWNWESGGGTMSA